MVTDGPYAETKEQLLGFYLVDCATVEEAVAIARELEQANPGVGAYEIRPLFAVLGGKFERHCIRTPGRLTRARSACLPPRVWWQRNNFFALVLILFGTNGVSRRGAASELEGLLKIAELTCPVALYTAASTSERIAFHTINRQTGHRVRRQFVDSETGKPVEQRGPGQGLRDRQGRVRRSSSRTRSPRPFPKATRPCRSRPSSAATRSTTSISTSPIILAPADRHAEEAFVLIREGMRRSKVAALAQTVLFRRVRTLLIRAAWRRSDRDHAELRLRGALGRGSVRRHSRR